MTRQKLLHIGLLLLTIPLTTYGQKKDSLRNLRVEKFPDHFFVWPVIKQRSTTFDFKNNSTGKHLQYRPNTNVPFGFGVYIFEIFTEVTFALPIDKQKEFLYGKSSSQDLQANMLGKNWGADFFISNYHGFYRDDPGNQPPAQQPYPQRPDIHISNIGVNGIYIINRNKFSLMSAYNYAERQLKSGGSFLISGTINSFNLHADSAVLPQRYMPEFGNVIGFDQLHYTAFSISPGYTYNFIFKNIFLNASLALGPSQNWTSYRINNEKKSYDFLSTFVDARVALGYNGKRFFTGVSYVGQNRNVRISNTVNFNSTSNTFKIVIGYRFKEFGILKKRAWDLVPDWAVPKWMK